MRLIDADALLEQMQPVSGFEVNNYAEVAAMAIANAYIKLVEKQPTVQPDTTTHDSIPAETGKNDGDGTSGDCISRQAAIDFVGSMNMCDEISNEAYKKLTSYLDELPSAQPERTCVNCGRTANNGGWYADGRTRCPIEEHYALPKDGYCHLWEKRNITDDDYPERRTDE